MRVTLSLIILLTVCISSCKTDFTPKPKGYPKVVLPVKGYTLFSDPACPFSFEAPVYGVINKDQKYASTVKHPDCITNIQLPDLNAAIYITYLALEDVDIDSLMDMNNRVIYDAHIQVAEFIQDIPLNEREDLKGYKYDYGGNTATPVQFWFTDTEQHFVKGSLYFDHVNVADSLLPVIDFISSDIDHLIDTWQWENTKNDLE